MRIQDKWLAPAAAITAALIARKEPGERCTPDDAALLFKQVAEALQNTQPLAQAGVFE